MLWLANSSALFTLTWYLLYLIIIIIIIIIIIKTKPHETWKRYRENFDFEMTCGLVQTHYGFKAII